MPKKQPENRVFFSKKYRLSMIYILYRIFLAFWKGVGFVKRRGRVGGFRIAYSLL